MNPKNISSTILILFGLLSTLMLSVNVEAQAPRKAQIAFSSDRDGDDEIYVMDIDGKNPRNLTNHPGADYSPVWSPDGRRIAFLSLRKKEDGLYVMDADGNNQHYLAHMHQHGYAAWSPDGKQIAFQSSHNEKNMDIYVMNADGSSRHRLTRHPARDRYPSWSPDGKKILFYSERDGRSGEVYVMDAHGNNQHNLTNHPASDGLFGASWFDPRFARAVAPIGMQVTVWGWLKWLGR